MQTLLLVTLTFIMIAVASLVWLTIRAFKTTSGWGVAVMFLSPVSATVFGVKFWEKQREPFLLFITTFTAAFALSIYLVTATGGMALLQLTSNLYHGISPEIAMQNMKAGAMRTSFSVGDDQAPQFDHANASDNPATAGENAHAKAAVESVDKLVKEKTREPRYRLTYVPVKLSEVKKYVGATAKVTRKNSEEKEYIITGVSSGYIEFAQRSRHGKYSFVFKSSNIESVRVLINEAY